MVALDDAVIAKLSQLCSCHELSANCRRSSRPASLLTRTPPSPPAPAAGLSLRTQELTAAFLLVRLFCSFMMEYDIHTLLDALTLAATGARAGLLLRVAGRCCDRCCVLSVQAAGRAVHAGSHRQLGRLLRRSTCCWL